MTLTIYCRLLYERVPKRTRAHMLHLDDPVTEVVRLARPSITHTLTDLPMGKYIVCGEAHEGGSDTPYQTSCFETRIERLETDSESTQLYRQNVIRFYFQLCKWVCRSSLWSRSC